MADAASTFSTLCAPRERNFARPADRTSFPSRARQFPALDERAVLTAPLAAEPEHPALGLALANSAATASSALSTASRRRSGSRRCALWRGVGFEAAVAVEVVGRDVEHAAISGGTSRMVSSWKLETSSTSTVSARRLSTSAITACRCCRRPDWHAAGSRRMSPTSVVVVVLPLVPVMANHRAGQERAGQFDSPSTGICCARARFSSGSSAGTPGLTTMKSGVQKAAFAVAAGLDGDALFEQLGDLGLELHPGAHFRHHHARAPLAQEARRRHAAGGHADDQYPPAADLHAGEHYTPACQSGYR